MHIKNKLLVIGILFLVATAIIPLGKAEDALADKAEQIQSKLTHKQEVWLYALEWCESRGDLTAINPKDKDGTPSYYSFQFKPSTLKYYGQMYGLIEEEISNKVLMEKLKSYELQKSIVTEMILDPGIKWRQQFPDCVKKLGLPPKN